MAPAAPFRAERHCSATEANEGSISTLFRRAGSDRRRVVSLARLRRLVAIGCLSAYGLTGCGGSGGGPSSLKLGQAASLARPGKSATSFKEYKYKTAVVSVTKAGPNDLNRDDLGQHSQG